MAEINAVIEESDKSAYSADIKVSGYSLSVDEPADFDGGGGTGPSPMDLLAASLSACTVMTIRWYARQKQLSLEHVDAEIIFDPSRAHFVKNIAITGSDLSREQKEKLLVVASKCPVNKILTGEATVETLFVDKLFADD